MFTVMSGAHKTGRREREKESESVADSSTDNCQHSTVPYSKVQHPFLPSLLPSSRVECRVLRPSPDSSTIPIL